MAWTRSTTIGKAILAAIFVAATTMPALAGAACVVTTRDRDASVRSASGRLIALTPSRPAAIEDCSPLMIVTGRVCVISEDAALDRPCRRFSSGAEVTTSAVDEAFSVLSVLVDHLTGELRERAGGKRLSDAEEIPGFPSGDVLMPENDMLVPLVWVKDGPVTAFVLEDPVARTRISMPIERDAIRIARRHLAVGRSYKWQATIGGGNRTGSFTLVRPSEQVELNEQLRQIAANPDYAADPAARGVARAMVLYGEHFTFDALQEISGFVQRR